MTAPSDAAVLDLADDLMAEGGRGAPPLNGYKNGHDGGGEALDLHALLSALQAMRAGDFSVRMPSHLDGMAGRVADAFNDIVSANERMAEQLEHVGQVVGRDGKTKTRVRFGLSTGAWGDMEESVNTLIDDLLWPTTQVTRTITAVAKGDLLQTMPLDVDGRPLKGEFLRSATIVNTMIKQLSVFTSEVTRVAREVGTDGKLGGQAQVVEVTGVWKDLTDSVNSMASNLTAQVRNIAEVTIAVANGDLTRSIQVEAGGEVAELKDNINTMSGNLRLTTDRNTEQDWLKTNLARFTNSFEVLERIRDDETLADTPVVVFTGRELTPDEDAQLHTMARSVVVKGVESPKRMRVLTATTGLEAVSIVESTPELAIVLMDIMMPGMDGYETLGVIRANPTYRRLPIIALRAKAMKGDQEKCLEAGASDYLAKPVNTKQLRSALRMWLHQ